MIDDDVKPARVSRAPVGQIAVQYLCDLRAAEDTLFDRIRDLERVTEQSQPSKADFTQARFKISQASLIRSTLFNRVCDRLIGSVSSADEKSICILKVRQTQLYSVSRSHVIRWTTDQSLQDWKAYCAASKQIRGRMKEMLQLERALLHPILYRQSTGVDNISTKETVTRRPGVQSTRSSSMTIRLPEGLPGYD